MHQTCRRAFTLVELIVVVFIIVIVLAAVFWSLPSATV
jgi:prepilin-type N-terminal cleavage/methylation domain-containing protein